MKKGIYVLNTPAGGQLGCHCLLVEDSKFDQYRIERVLHRTMPSRLSTAETLADAYRAIAADRFDLVICNNALPDGLGIDFVRTLRKHPSHRDIPVVMMSDRPSEMIKTRAIEAGVTTVVSKGRFTRDCLVQAVQGTHLMQA
ncbi:MAG: response regulator [Pseudomonadota bacterium]